MTLYLHVLLVPNQKGIYSTIRNLRSLVRAAHIYTLCASSSIMANYRPAFAGHTPAADDSIKDFVANFYTTSDTPGKDAEWVEFFQPDATIILEKKEATGPQGTLHQGACSTLWLLLANPL